MKTSVFLLFFILIGIHYQGQCQTATVKHKTSTSSPISDKPQEYFTLKLVIGDTLANIYSRTIAYTGDNFSPVVFRVSGTSTYQVVDNSGSTPVFNETDLYDGQPESKAVAVIGLDGTTSYNGKSAVNSSASGLLYSKLIWGPIHAHIQEGDSWKNTISQPWESGGPGTQVVTVVALDEQHQTVILQREGNSEGFFDSDFQQINITTKDDKKLKMKVSPGTAHWIGYTTFKNGIVLSDELLVTRPVTLSADSLQFKADMREYILLNARPHKTR